jgi:hypothetical protein
VRDRGATPQARAAALRNAAPVPEAGRRLVTQVATAGGDPALAGAALAAYAWTDRPGDAVTVLLANTQGDQAGIAVAAVGRASRFVPPPALLDALDPARGKVTFRKEAVRLLAARSVPGAADALWRLWQDPGLHRDVRVAVVSAARQRAGDPGMWRVLRAAGAAGDRDAVLALLAADPWLVPAGLRADYAALVAAAGAGPDRQVTAQAWAVLPRWAPWLGDVTGAVTARLGDLHDRTVWPSVVRALVSLVAAGTAEATLVAAVRTLAELDGPTPSGPDGAVDRPARRRLEALVEQLTAWSGRAAADAPGRHALGAAGRELSTVDGFVPAAATLLLEAADLTDPAGLAGPLELTADRPVLAARLAGQLRRRLERLVADPEVPRRIAVSLAAGQGLAEGLFALAYTTGGRELRWPPAWRTVVDLLRDHPEAEVRDAALAVPVDQ